MMYEMEKILAIVMSNKGLYPKYIKSHTIQKQRSMQGISLRKGGNFGFVGGLTNNPEMEKILAIVMSNKGLYPKYIKRQTIQKQLSMHAL